MGVQRCRKSAGRQLVSERNVVIKIHWWLSATETGVVRWCRIRGIVGVAALRWGIGVVTLGLLWSKPLVLWLLWLTPTAL